MYRFLRKKSIAKCYASICLFFYLFATNPLGVSTAFLSIPISLLSDFRFVNGLSGVSDTSNRKSVLLAEIYFSMTPCPGSSLLGEVIALL